MKRKIILSLAIGLILSCTACAKAPGIFPGTSPTPDNVREKEDDSAVFPGQSSTKDGQPEESPPEEVQTKSSIYPPSIFVIEASGTWRQEMAMGYYADYECEFYADKLDELDNQSASGQYTGVFWMKTTLDTGDFLKELLKDVPVDMQFDAGGEGICNYISVILMNSFEQQLSGGSYTIPDGQGGSLAPSGDVLAARGSFTAEAVEAYLDVNARGEAGESLEHHDTQSGSTEVDFILHVEPDPDYTADERKVTLYLSTAEGMSVTLGGVLRRLPGYSEDLKAYTSQGKRGEILDKHLQ